MTTQKTCDICSKVQERQLAQDHNHESGALRGLLCINCNLMLGNAHDSPRILRKAIAYLKAHSQPKGIKPRDCSVCRMKPMAMRNVCRACHAAIYRRTKLGDSWEQAMADRHQMLDRRLRDKITMKKYLDTRT